MQASLFHVPLVRPTAAPWRQPSMHLQLAARRPHGLKLCGASVEQSRFLHSGTSSASAAHQKSRAELITPAALTMGMEGLTATSSPLLVGALTLLAGAVLFLLGRGKNKKTAGKRGELPPGPSTVEFLAMFLKLRRSVFHVGPILRELHARYGGIISVRLFKTLVFVQDRAIAHRMLVQGGATFADRPATLYDPWPLFFTGSVITTPYGPYWRRVRRNLVEALNPARVARFEKARRSTRDALLARLAAATGDGEPVKVRMIFRRTVFDLLTYMSLGSGLSTRALDDIFALQIKGFDAVLSFPVFSFLPAITKKIFWKRWASYEALAKTRAEIFYPLLQARRDLPSPSPSPSNDTTVLVEDDDPPCYADTLLAVRLPDEGDRALTDAEITTLCAEVMVAGTDTTASLLEWIMAELVSHPDAQAKVYEEVRGDGELKEGDLRGMRYLKAVVLEGLRMHPGAHLIFTHRTMEDTDIGDYTVPKDAQVHFLVADYGLDESAWTEPHVFRPERFLDGGEGCGVDVTGSREVKMMPFGAGRRLCPGYSLATLHLEYFVGSLVKEFQWLPAVEGEEIDMTEDLDTIIVLKDPLRARLVPRTTS